MTLGNLLVVCGGFRATKYVYTDCVYWQRASLRLRRNTRWKSIYTIGYPTVPAPLKHGLCLPILLYINPTKTLYVHQKVLGINQNNSLVGGIFTPPGRRHVHLTQLLFLEELMEVVTMRLQNLLQKWYSPEVVKIISENCHFCLLY